MVVHAGFRSVIVFEQVTEGNFGSTVPLLVEVSNEGEDTAYFYANDNPEGGYRAGGIPVFPGETRSIPLRTYWFTASKPVTVVGYLP